MAKAVNFKNKVLSGGNHAITLDYGYTYSDGSFHKGIDLVTGKNIEDYVCAIDSGTVVDCADNIQGTNKSTKTDGMGNYVILQHENGWRTRYQHMKYGSVVVRNGQKVEKGQKLGIIGNTGNSRGRHLHFDISNAVRQSGSFCSSQRYYVDPKPFLYGEKSVNGEKTETVKPKYTTGNYKITGDVNVRTGSGTNYSRVKFVGMTANAQSQVKKITGKEADYFPKGMKVTITKVSGDWGKCPSGWISLKYAEKI